MIDHGDNVELKMVAVLSSEGRHVEHEHVCVEHANVLSLSVEETGPVPERKFFVNCGHFNKQRIKKILVKSH